MSLILVIDDDPDILALLTQQLREREHRVLTTPSAENGLDLAQTGNPDLVILDIMMPGLDGLEVLRRLRADPVTRLTPVIMITAESKQPLVVEAMKFGVADYLLKPYTASQLDEKLESALSWNVFHRIRLETDPTLRLDARDGRLVITLFEHPTRATAEMLAWSLTSKMRAIMESAPCVLDLRLLTDLADNELPVLEECLDLFLPYLVHIVAGRNLGRLLEAGLDERAQLYLSFGDFLLAMRSGSF